MQEPPQVDIAFARFLLNSLGMRRIPLLATLQFFIESEFGEKRRLSIHVAEDAPNESRYISIDSLAAAFDIDVPVRASPIANRREHSNPHPHRTVHLGRLFQLSSSGCLAATTGCFSAHSGRAGHRAQ
jgi:hypothetical protein